MKSETDVIESEVVIELNLASRHFLGTRVIPSFEKVGAETAIRIRYIDQSLELSKARDLVDNMRIGREATFLVKQKVYQEKLNTWVEKSAEAELDPKKTFEEDPPPVPKNPALGWDLLDETKPLKFKIIFDYASWLLGELVKEDRDFTIEYVPDQQSGERKAKNIAGTPDYYTVVAKTISALRMAVSSIENKADTKKVKDG